MRLTWGLLLGAVLSAQASRLEARQLNTGSSSQGGGDTGTTTTTSSGGGGGGSGGDTTVFVTQTVTASGGSTITTTTNVDVSSIVTVTGTTTDLATTTVTSSDGDTSTSVIWVTTTSIINVKRGISGDFIRRAPAQIDAAPTPILRRVPGIEAAYPGYALERRAIVTGTVTVTVAGGVSTVVQTVTRNIKSTSTYLVHITSFVTSTVQLNAKTTITVTSTATIKQTVASDGGVVTETSGPSSNPNSGDSGSSGLSTGAKAGIGAGVGVAALAGLAGIAYFCCVKRRRGPKPDPDDLLGPSSEVPVGAAASHSARPMSQNLASTPGSAPRRDPVLPNVQPEGYRGTAMGDGRHGYAKPDPYGAAYGPTRSTTTTSSHPGRSATLSPGDHLPRHPTPDGTMASVSPVSANNTSPRAHAAELGNEGAGGKWHSSEAAEMSADNSGASKWHNENAAEIDSHAVMSHQSGPVFEMPTENYK